MLVDEDIEAKVSKSKIYEWTKLMEDYFKNTRVRRKSVEQYSFFNNIQDRNIYNPLFNFETINESTFTFTQIKLEKTKNYLISGYYQSYKYFWDNKECVTFLI